MKQKCHYLVLTSVVAMLGCASQFGLRLGGGGPSVSAGQSGASASQQASTSQQPRASQSPVAPASDAPGQAMQTTERAQPAVRPKWCPKLCLVQQPR